LDSRIHGDQEAVVKQMQTRTNEKVNRLQPAYWLSAAMIPLLMVAAIAGLFFPSLYRDGPIVTSTDRGTDLATLVIYVPTLVVSLILARRSSHRAQIVWICIVGWITYNYVVYAFAGRFNPLFLVYVVLVSLSVFTLAIVLWRYDPDTVASYIKPSLPVKVISVFLALTAALFLLLWTSDILIATFGHPAPKEIPAGNAVEVSDLAVAIPLLVLAAVRLWQRRATGYALAGVMLTSQGRPCWPSSPASSSGASLWRSSCISRSGWPAWRCWVSSSRMSGPRTERKWSVAEPRSLHSHGFANGDLWPLSPPDHRG
jgi:hypothetical protein